MLAITNGKLMTITQGVVENGTLLIEDGKIAALGAQVEIPAQAEILDARGKWVMPGLIEAHSHIAVQEEPKVTGEMGDLNENSSAITPQVRVMDAFYPKDMGIEAVRRAGFTTCCVLPGSANLIGGTGFAFKTREGRVLEDLYLPGTEVMKMALGENPRRNGRGHEKLPKTRMGNAALLRETLFDAKVYSDQKKAAETDPSKAPKPDFKLEALVPVVRGEMLCRIHCHRSDDIMTALRVAEEFGLRISLEHATEGYQIADILAEKGIFCVVGPLMTGPYKKEVWNRAITTPGVMAKAGVKVCLTEDSGSMTKLLPSHAGHCMAAGMSEEAALKALTIYPAQLLGLAQRIGSLEVGKDADLALFDGHPYCNFTHCTHTIIDGVVYENSREAE